MSIKYLYVKEVLESAPGMMWMDASFRLQTGNLQPIFDLAVRNGGVVQFIQTRHFMFNATHPGTWEYLVTNPLKLQTTYMYSANSILLYNTEKIYRNILYWWILCALEKECITPTGSGKMCRIISDSIFVYHKGCHRQDQSSFGTLIANLYHFNETLYSPENGEEYVLKINSKKSKFLDGQVCQ